MTRVSFQLNFDMKRAAASEGADRQRLIQLALAWHELARERREVGAD